jgi:hypothetical protein
MFSIALCLAMLPLCNSSAQGQSHKLGVRDPLSPIPVHQRTRLIERLNLLVEYQNAQQWEKVYDLLIESIKGRRSKKDYANSRREVETIAPISTLIAFVPTEAIPIDQWQDGGEWQLLGCAKYHRKGGIILLKSAVGAELLQGEWFFTEVGVATQIDGPEEPCSMPKQPSQQTKKTAARSSSCCSAASGKKFLEGHPLIEPDASGS